MWHTTSKARRITQHSTFLSKDETFEAQLIQNQMEEIKIINSDTKDQKSWSVHIHQLMLSDHSLTPWT